MSLLRRSIVVSLISGMIALSQLGVSKGAPVTGPVKEQAPAVVTGQVVVKGGIPLSWGEVLLYNTAIGPPPRPQRYDRTPDIVRGLDAEGRFKVTIPPGTYYLGAIKRLSGETMGPPREGDYLMKTVDAQGKVLQIEAKAGKTLDVGTLPEAVPAEAKDLVKKAMITGIEGKVSDAISMPVSGAVVLAFLEPSLKGRPVFISTRTGNDGIYHLSLTAGKYFLRVRNSSSSGPPRPGEIVGFYGEGEPSALEVKDGEILHGINFQVVLFGGRGPRAGGQ